MITTVTLNATMDKTCFVGDLRIGMVNRVPDMRCFPGGKGINAARVAHDLGCPVLTTGFVAGFNGSFIETELSRRGLLHDFVRIDGESRVSLNIIDRFSGKTTEILESGPQIEADDVLAIRDKVRASVASSSVLAICGSMPEGTPVTLYADFIEMAHHEGIISILDASGEALLAGIEARPTCVKPNEDELAAVLGRKAESDEDVYEAVQRLADKGISCVAATLGERGAVVGIDGQLFRVHVPVLKAVNVVGCGDAFVGTMCAGYYRRTPVEEIIRMAAATGAANALTEEAGGVNLNDMRALLGEIRIEPIS